MYKRLLLLALLLPPVLQAQGHLLLDESAARKNLIVAPPAVAPPGVHLSGKVVVLIEISPDGHVASAKADTGNSKLRNAAVDAVRTWRFRPFTLHNVKVTANAKLTVEVGAQPISGHASQPAAVADALPDAPSAPAVKPASPPEFQALQDRCRALVEARGVPAQEASACRQAAEAADALYGEKTFMPRRAAYVFAATAYMRTNDLKAAVAFGSKAVAVVAQGHDDNAGASAAYTVRGQARAFAGDLPGADLDLIKAEGFERRVLAADLGKAAEPATRAALRNLLLFHAKLLGALKEPEKAAAKTAEAGKLA